MSHNQIHSLHLERPKLEGKTLRCRGNLSLLSSPSVAIVGSRKISDKGKEAARDAAFQLGYHGVNIVSGYASGIDYQAHYDSLRAGGTTTIVLPHGIASFKNKNDIHRFWSWERVLVMSEFDDGAPFTGPRAFQRNGTVCGLSQAVIVIQAGKNSGTMNTARQALKMGLPVFTVRFENFKAAWAEGNEDLLQNAAYDELLGMGVTPLLRSGTSCVLNIDPVMETLGLKKKLWQYVEKNYSRSLLSRRRQTRYTDSTSSCAPCRPIIDDSNHFKEVHYGYRPWVWFSDRFTGGCPPISFRGLKLGGLPGGRVGCKDLEAIGDWEEKRAAEVR